MNEPLPCPFCGREVAPYKISTGQNYIQCYNNDCEINYVICGPYDNEEELIRRWNKRDE